MGQAADPRRQHEQGRSHGSTRGEGQHSEGARGELHQHRHGDDQEALTNGEKVTISDFGTFTVSQRREFTGHNPKNGMEIRVPARKIPVFRAGKGLKEALNT